MEARVDHERNFTQKRFYKVFREDRIALSESVSNAPENDSMSFQRRVAEHFKAMCEAEAPIVFPNERICFTRTNTNITPAYRYEDLGREFNVKDKCWNVINNICPDYALLLQNGLDGIRELLLQGTSGRNTADVNDFVESCLITIDAIQDLAFRYEEEAARVSNTLIQQNMQHVPMKAAESFLGALQSVRFISAMFYLNGNYQLGFGRMDQYLYPYYEEGIKTGLLTREQAREDLRAFFISLNRDTDLYFGIQQGDNGQSVMLGGVRPDGSSAINELTYLILEVSKDLCLIDPKINVRIDSQTPDDLLHLGCEVTQKGLGFPQYSNDEVVIPALVRAGYELEDARNYTVAACWEFIIPGKGLDIVNQGAVSFPYAVNQAFLTSDPTCVTETELDEKIRQDLEKQVLNILRNRNQYLLPSPLVSLFFKASLDAKQDITLCAKYRNRGIHGAGSASAADALAIIKSCITHKHRDRLAEIQQAVIANYEGYDSLQKELKNCTLKVGNADPEVDRQMKMLFDNFADVCEKHSSPTCRIRPGSGSAQFYIWLSDRKNDWLIEPTVGATADGRLAGEPFPSSLAPSSGVKVAGLISVLKSFSVIDYTKIMNGGPITVEFSPATLRNEEGLQKLSEVIRYFVILGNQQLQLNLLDYRVLCDAMKHPERHTNLIVRVWGWSGYFCELTPEFQRQILNRHRYSL